MRPIHWRKFHKFLIYVGCEYQRKRGSHRVYTFPDILRPVIVAEHTKPIPVFVIKNNLRTLGISEKDYLDIIRKL